MKTFKVPTHYRSPLIQVIKQWRNRQQGRKDFTPHWIDFGPVHLGLPRHFGFCFGVERAIELVYQAIESHPDRRLFLISEMIHNPDVNAHLVSEGVGFLSATDGKRLRDWSELTPDDVVITPAFGASLSDIAELERLGVELQSYDTTCPFVSKVWKRSAELGQGSYSVVIHGKMEHEETRATFSRQTGPSLVVRNLEETETLAGIIEKSRPVADFAAHFAGKHTPGFDPERDLQRLGVVNQTTMLAGETQAVAERLRTALIRRYGEDRMTEHFADTSDTLCYATNENQTASLTIAGESADLVFVIGGYNSSNTKQLVTIFSRQIPTFFVERADCLAPATGENAYQVTHYDIESHRVSTARLDEMIPAFTRAGADSPCRIILSSGASCPDSTLEELIHRLLEYFPGHTPPETVAARYDT